MASTSSENSSIPIDDDIIDSLELKCLVEALGNNTGEELKVSFQFTYTHLTKSVRPSQVFV